METNLLQMMAGTCGPLAQATPSDGQVTSLSPCRCLWRQPRVLGHPVQSGFPEGRVNWKTKSLPPSPIMDSHHGCCEDREWRRLAISKQHGFSELDLSNGYCQEQGQGVLPVEQLLLAAPHPSWVSPSMCCWSIVLNLSLAHWWYIICRGRFTAGLLMSSGTVVLWRF